MLAARGVSLGLGKINLSDLHHLPSEKHRVSQLKREDKPKKPRIIVIKKADAKGQGQITCIHRDGCINIPSVRGFTSRYYL